MAVGEQLAWVADGIAVFESSPMPVPPPRVMLRTLRPGCKDVEAEAAHAGHLGWRQGLPWCTSAEAH